MNKDFKSFFVLLTNSNLDYIDINRVFITKQGNSKSKHSKKRFTIPNNCCNTVHKLITPMFWSCNKNLFATQFSGVNDIFTKIQIVV